MNRIFLDTNIILDFLLERKDFYNDAKSIITLGVTKKIKLSVSSLSFSNIAYIARKDIPIDDLYSLFEDFSKFINISPVGKGEVIRAIELKAKDFEDALQYFSALSAKADCFVTRNLDDFPFSEIPVLSPHNFLEQQY